MRNDYGAAYGKVGIVFNLARGGSLSVDLLKMAERRKGAARVNFGGRSMYSIRPGLSDLIEDRAACPAKFCSEIGGLDVDLLNGVENNDISIAGPAYIITNPAAIHE